MYNSGKQRNLIRVNQLHRKKPTARQWATPFPLWLARIGLSTVWAFLFAGFCEPYQKNPYRTFALSSTDNENCEQSERYRVGQPIDIPYTSEKSTGKRIDRKAWLILASELSTQCLLSGGTGLIAHRGKVDSYV